MLVLLAIGFVAGAITAISPCVLPVLPILLAGGASGGERRPYAIVAGLVASFTFFTLAAAWLLDALGLPQDVLRNLAVALLFLVAATLLFPSVAHWVERPFYPLTRLRPGDVGGGLLLGASLGLVFVPCAGPVLAAVAVLAAGRQVGGEVVLLTLAYALGAALPMLAIALFGRRAADALRPRIAWLRPALGAIVGLTALAIAFGLDKPFQTSVPGYTEALQERIERSARADEELGRLTGRSGVLSDVAEGELDDFGPAPELAGVTGWLNTTGGKPLSLAALRGRVVVIDFWTYSCVNCLRTLPYLEAWDRAYRDAGLTIVGVHTPEFAFEREGGNVRRAVRDLGVRYPVAQDNDYATWHAYANRYWPSKYFVDRRGHVRFVHFGEGEYERSEEVIRTLLAEEGNAPGRKAVVRGAVSASGPHLTPETYLGFLRLDRYAGSPVRPNAEAEYRLPADLPTHSVAYGGTWRVERERAVAGSRARLRLAFRAREVHLVLGGRGTVEALLDGRRTRAVQVDGDRLYTLLRLDRPRDGLLELRFSPGVEAYAFTFG
jgi:cytochrome c biogenesis protein CcdA/thiol-disulfide isomerase/thioredoxin